MSASAHCAACGAEATATCNHCDNEYCADHITREAHNCLGEFSDAFDEDDGSSDATESDLRSGHTPYHQREGGGLAPPPEKGDTSNQETQSTADSESSTGEDTQVHVDTSSGRFIGGAIVLSVGFLISLTGFGAIFGIPMAILGFGIMFPRFTAAAVILAVISLLWLLSQL